MKSKLTEYSDYMDFVTGERGQCVQLFQLPSSMVAIAPFLVTNAAFVYIKGVH